MALGALTEGPIGDSRIALALDHRSEKKAHSCVQTVFTARAFKAVYT